MDGTDFSIKQFHLPLEHRAIKKKHSKLKGTQKSASFFC